MWRLRNKLTVHLAASIYKLNQFRALQTADVVADVPERGIDLGGDPTRARDAIAQHPQDAYPQRMRERLHKARIIDFGDLPYETHPTQRPSQQQLPRAATSAASIRADGRA